MNLKKVTGSIVCIAAIAMFGIQAAFADVTVVYKMTTPDGTGTQTIRYADKQHIRVDMADAFNHETTMMKLDNKVYMITGKVVQDMDQLAGMMAMMGKGKGAKNRPTDHAPITYKDTGRTETIAGITGKVYHFEEQGRKHEVVLAENKDLQAAVLGLVEITQASLGVTSDNPMDRALQDASLKNMAMLRMDDFVRLQSINTGTTPDSTFELPSKPQQMGGMGGLMKGLLRQ